MSRVPNEYDRRSVNIVVTERGWEATEKMISIAEEISNIVISCLSEEEADILMDILKKIRKHLLSTTNVSATIRNVNKTNYENRRKVR